MRIYRLENERGGGPFNGAGIKDLDENNRFERELADALGWTHVVAIDDIFTLMMLPEGKELLALEPTEDHPHHANDVPPPDWTDEHNWKVGCKSMEQLNYWFPKSSYPFFNRHGFQLVIYEVECDHVHFGKYQVLFCTDHVTVISKEKLV